LVTRRNPVKNAHRPGFLNRHAERGGGDRGIGEGTKKGNSGTKEEKNVPMSGQM